MVEINIWNDCSKCFTSIYEEYSRHPYCSPERTKYSYSKEYKEYARPFIPVKKEMMDKLPCGLLLGHIKMLWIISFDYLNSNYRVASYFEYEYGVNFREELLVLESEKLIIINNDNTTNRSTYHLTDEGYKVYNSNKEILELYELKREFYNKSKTDKIELSKDKKYYELFQKAFVYYFEDSYISQEINNLYSKETISKIKISINNIFSKQQNTNSYRNISIILSKSTGLNMRESLTIISSFSSALNFISKIDSWSKSNVNKYYIMAHKQLGIDDLCIKDDMKVYNLSENHLFLLNLPHCLGCKCVVLAYFGEQSTSGMVRVNDPISFETFEMDRKSNFTSWINKLVERHGKEIVENHIGGILNEEI